MFNDFVFCQKSCQVASCHQVFFPQGKLPKKIHAILTETLACFLLGQAKDLSAPLYKPWA